MSLISVINEVESHAGYVLPTTLGMYPPTPSRVHRPAYRPTVVHAADLAHEAVTALTHHVAELTFPDGQLTVMILNFLTKSVSAF